MHCLCSCIIKQHQLNLTLLTLKVLNFWKLTSYCNLKPLWSGMGGSSAGSYLTDPTSPIPSYCASIVTTSTVKVKWNSLCHHKVHHSEIPPYSDQKCICIVFSEWCDPVWGSIWWSRRGGQAMVLVESTDRRDIGSSSSLTDWCFTVYSKYLSD